MAILRPQVDILLLLLLLRCFSALQYIRCPNYASDLPVLSYMGYTDRAISSAFNTARAAFRRRSLMILPMNLRFYYTFIPDYIATAADGRGDFASFFLSTIYSGDWPPIEMPLDDLISCLFLRYDALLLASHATATLILMRRYAALNEAAECLAAAHTCKIDMTMTDFDDMRRADCFHDVGFACYAKVRHAAYFAKPIRDAMTSHSTVKKAMPQRFIAARAARSPGKCIPHI